MNELTKDEFRALLEIQAKNVEQLTTIANHLAIMVDTQNDIHARLYNGMTKEIVDNINLTVRDCNKHCSEAHTELKTTLSTIPTNVDEKLRNSDISKDIKHAKWFIAVTCILIVVSTVTIKIIDHISTNHNISITSGLTK